MTYNLLSVNMKFLKNDTYLNSIFNKLTVDLTQNINGHLFTAELNIGCVQKLSVSLFIAASSIIRLKRTKVIFIFHPCILLDTS